MKRNKSSRLIAILCAVVMFAEQIWGSGLYVNAAGETDATTVSETQQDQTEETKAEEPAPEESAPEVTEADNTSTEDTTAPVTDQDNEEKTDETISSDNNEEDNSDVADEEEVIAVDGTEIEVSEEENNTRDDGINISGLGVIVGTELIIGETVTGNLSNDLEVITTDDLTLDQKRSITKISFVKNAKVKDIPAGFWAKEGEEDNALTTIDFSNADNLINIGTRAFYKCNNLTSVDLSGTESLAKIKIEAFSNCAGLTSVNIGPYVTDIWPEAFKKCEALTTVTLGKKLKNIYDGVFNECKSLSTVVLNTVEPTGVSAGFEDPASGQTRNYQYDGIFKECSIEEIIFDENSSIVPEKMFYKASFKAGAEIVIPAHIQSIKASAFEESKSIQKIKIEDDPENLNPAERITSKLAYIADRAFYNCTNLSVIYRSDEIENEGRISFPHNFTTIGNLAFMGDVSINCVDMENAGITEIGKQAFMNCTGITSVKLASATKADKTGASIFEGCSKLEYISIPASLEAIGEREFYNCHKLSTIVFEGGITGSSIKTIKKQAFGCAQSTTNRVVSVELPDSITTLGDGAFEYNNNLQSVHVPQKLTKISNNTFSHCAKLRNADMPNTVTEIGDKAFYGCGPLILQWEKATIEEGRNSLPAKLEKIGSETFWGCSSFPYIVFPEGIKSIGGGAFSSCESMEYIEFTAMPETCGTSIFSECNAVKDVVFPEEITSIPGNLFMQCDFNPNIVIVIPNTVETIGNYAFAGTSNDPVGMDIVFEKDPVVTQIGKGAFQYNRTMTRFGVLLYAPEREDGGKWTNADWKDYDWSRWSDPEKPEDWAKGEAWMTADLKPVTNESIYEKCEYWVSGQIPKTVEVIGEAAFDNCTGLQGLIIPEGPDGTDESGKQRYFSIGKNAFAHCGNLKHVVMLCKNLKTDTVKKKEDSLFSKSNLQQILIGEDFREFPQYLFSEAVFAVGDGNNNYEGSKILIRKSIVRIGDYCFSNVENLSLVEIEDESQLEEIGNHAFENTKNLIRLNNINPKTLKRIGEYAFDGCNSLEFDISIKATPNLEFIGKDAFKGCEKIEEIQIPGGVNSIEAETFMGCIRLKKADLTNAVIESIKKSAFEGCNNLEGIEIPYGTVTIETCAFKDCICGDDIVKSLDTSKTYEVIIPDTVETIGKDAFSGCTRANFRVTEKSVAQDWLNTAGNMPDNAEKHEYPTKLVYELDQGTNAPSNRSGFDEQTYTIKAPVRAGSTFMGWYYDAEKKVAVEKTGDVYTVNKDKAHNDVITIYADWQTTEYVIVYHLRGGVDPGNPISYNMWTEDIVLKNPTFKGATFQGWFTDLDDKDSKVTVIRKGSQGNIELYAAWSGNNVAKSPTPSIESGAEVVAGSVLRLYCETPGAVIYYSVSETEDEPPVPEAKAENEYQGSIIIDKHIKIKAFATAENYIDSAPAEFEYFVVSEAENWRDVVDPEDQQIYNGKPENVPNDIWVAGIPDVAEYTGEAITFNNLRVYDYKTLLIEGTDYTISYKNNKKVADKNAAKAPTVVVKGKGSYSGSKEFKFSIKEVRSIASNPGAETIKKKDVILTNQIVTYDYNGVSSEAIGLKVMSAGKVLVENTDYIVVFSKNRAGSATVTVKGIANYKGKVKKKFTIKAADLSKAEIMFIDENGNVVSNNKIDAKGNVVKKTAADYVYGYQKGGAQPGYHVFLNGRRLIKGIDFTEAYSGNTPKGNKSTATLAITGKKNYAGTAKSSFTVMPGNIAEISLGASGLKFKNKGVSAKDLKLTVIDTNGRFLVKNGEDGKALDYSVKYTYLENGVEKELGNVKVVLAPGTEIKVTVTGINAYRGVKATTATVYTYGIDSAKAKVTKAYEYDGKAKEPQYADLSVTFKGTPLGNKDYRIIGYTSNIKKGTAKVYLAGAGDYGGLKAVKFKIGKKKITK